MRDGSLPVATVRIATPKDEAALYALLLRLHKDNPDPADLPLDHVKVGAHVHAVCTGNGGIAGVIDGPFGSPDLIGSVGLLAITPWWSSATVISEHWLFLDPPYRDGTRHKALFDFALWHRRDMQRRTGLPLGLDISVLSNNRLAARERLWARHGARKVGALFYVPPDEDPV